MVPDIFTGDKVDVTYLLGGNTGHDRIVRGAFGDNRTGTDQIGRFDLEGQLQGLESVRVYCRDQLDNLAKDRDVRLRSYQTLGLCAGAALAILFV